MILYRSMIFLWWSRFRRLIEPVVRRLLKDADEIKTGPLRGYKFRGGLAQMLGIYEYDILERIQHYLTCQTVFYDIGANNGFFTLFAARCIGVDGHIFAFEPLPKNIASVQNVIRENNLLNCQVEGCAVTDFVGETDLYYTEDISTPSLRHTEEKGCLSLRVPTMTLDEYVLTHPEPAVIKLDVEGAEIAVLKGAKSLILSGSPPIWIIEIHDPQDEAEILSLLTLGGYWIEKLPKPGRGQNSYPLHVIALHREK